MKGYRKYNIAPVLYTTPAKYNFNPLCNGFTFYNQGTTNAYMNRVLVPAGSFLSVGGNEGEIYDGRLDIGFDVPGAGGNMVFVIEKYYVDGESYDKFGK